MAGHTFALFWPKHDSKLRKNPLDVVQTRLFAAKDHVKARQVSPRRDHGFKLHAQTSPSLRGLVHKRSPQTPMCKQRLFLHSPHHHPCVNHLGNKKTSFKRRKQSWFLTPTHRPVTDNKYIHFEWVDKWVTEQWFYPQKWHFSAIFQLKTDKSLFLW